MSADRASLDEAALWSAMQKLVRRISEALDRETYLDECLDASVELLSASRGLIVLFHDGGASSVVHARGPGRTLDPTEREEVSRSILAEVRDSGRSVFWEPMSAGSESMMSLGIVTAIAVPLRGHAKHREPGGTVEIEGVLYVDFRDRTRLVTAAHQQFLEAVALLAGGVLARDRRFAQARDQLGAPRPDPRAAGPTLEELLAPPSLRAARNEIEAALPLDSTILLLGESGTGKTLFAQAIAEASGRHPIVRATLGSSDDLNTITSELFGHERGAFSGAAARRTGLVELAHGGTLILDEILNLPAHAQQLLLDFTQFGTYRPLGHERAEPRRSQVRILAATNGDLDAAVRSGRFREDLYYRLATSIVTLPPLRARREDIPSLAEAYLRRVDRSRDWRLGVPLRRLLLAPDIEWRGNIRQLESVVQRARGRALQRDPSARQLGTEHIEPNDLGVGRIAIPPPGTVRDESQPLCAAFQIEPAELADSRERLERERRQLDTIEADLIRLALQRHRGVVAYAARELGTQRTSLLSRMDTLGIERPSKSGE